MELRPVKQYHDPKLPTRQIIDEYPELLRLVPRRWQTNPVVLSALAGICTLMLGSRILADKQPATVSRVAPLFYHGGGHADYGCISVCPPVFLSEDEARSIIQDEAKKSNMDFVTPGPELESVLILKRYYNDGKYTWVNEPLALDGQDTRHQIYFEYVSPEDLDTRPNAPTPYPSYDSRSGAMRVREHLAAKRPAGTYAVFYAPASTWADVEKRYNYEPNLWESADCKAEIAKMNAMVEDLDQEQLRKQVQDFIKWLKTQGVI